MTFSKMQSLSITQMRGSHTLFMQLNAAKNAIGLFRALKKLGSVSGMDRRVYNQRHCAKSGFRQQVR